MPPVRVTRIVLLSLAVACANQPPSDGARRARIEQVAVDTASRAWQHAAGVDSVRMRGDTAEVYVTPRDWRATDPPAATVHVMPDGRITTIKWVMGG